MTYVVTNFRCSLIRRQIDLNSERILAYKKMIQLSALSVQRIASQVSLNSVQVCCKWWYVSLFFLFKGRRKIDHKRKILTPRMSWYNWLFIQDHKLVRSVISELARTWGVWFYLSFVWSIALFPSVKFFPRQCSWALPEACSGSIMR